jgi:hypothetical protein
MGIIELPTFEIGGRHPDGRERPLGASKETPDRHKNPQTNVRLSEEAREALTALADRQGISQTAVVEQLIRDEARSKGLKIKGLSK